MQSVLYDTPDLEPQFKSIVSTCGGPEDINEGPQTAPSKRILRLCPQYNKPNDGVMIAIEIGLEKMRAACPHFDAWVGRLERIASSRATVSE